MLLLFNFFYVFFGFYLLLKFNLKIKPEHLPDRTDAALFHLSFSLSLSLEISLSLSPLTLIYSLYVSIILSPTFSLSFFISLSLTLRFSLLFPLSYSRYLSFLCSISPSLSHSHSPSLPFFGQSTSLLDNLVGLISHHHSLVHLLARPPIDNRF